MSPPEHEIPALTQLRESLREAARHDVAARAPRRRRRRGLFVAVAVLLGGAAAAGAAELISTGEPVPGAYQQEQRYQPANGLQVAVKAHDDVLPWGVAIYESRDGQQCAVVGRVRGVTLGELRGGTFHPYERGHPGACGDPERRDGYFVDVSRLDGRTIVYGRAARSRTYVAAVVDGKRYTARTGAGGAFVLVFKGEVKLSSLVAG